MQIEMFDLDSAYLHKFIALQDKYFTQENFIPSFKESLYATLNTSNPFFHNAKYSLILVLNDEMPIARALVTIDPRRVNEQSSVVGNIGYFECPNDKSISKLLMDTAIDWLKQNGATSVHGPMDLHIYNNYRFMTEGFDTSPFLAEPRNPSYYPSLFEDYGFEEDNYWRSWEIEEDELSKFYDFLNMIVTRRKNIHGIELSPIDIENIEDALSELYETALDIFSQNYSYSKISKEEFVAIFSKLKNFLAPNSFQIAKDSTGKIVGFMYGHIDFAEGFKKANGDYSKLIENMAYKPQRYIYHTFGVIKEMRFSDMTGRLTHSQIGEFKNIFPQSIAALTTSQKSIVERIKEPNRYYKMYKLEL